MLLRKQCMDTSPQPPGGHGAGAPSSGITSGEPATAPATMRSPWDQLTVVNMLLAVAAVTVCFGAPLIPAIAGALGAGMLLFIGRHLLTRGTGRSHSTARIPRGE